MVTMTETWDSAVFEDEPTFHSIRIFLAVVASGSMTGAGRQLGLTQSAVSQSMRRLERQVGVTLLARDGRLFLPTAAGAVLVERGSEILAETARLRPAARAAAEDVRRPHIRLGFIDSFASTAGPGLIREMLESAAAIRFSAFSGLAPAQGEALLRRHVDVVVTCDPMDSVDGLVRHDLMREPYILLVPAALAKSCAGKTLHDMAQQHRLVRHSARSHTGADVERHLRRVGVAAPRILEFDTAEAVIAMVAGGIGWAVTTPLCLLHGHAHAAGAVPLPLPSPGFSRTLRLVGHAGGDLPLQRRVAAIARTVLANGIVPRMTALAPWLSENVVVRHSR